MLSDSSHEIRQQADSALSEFLQEIKNSPVRLLLTMNAQIPVLLFSIPCAVTKLFEILCNALSSFLFF